MAKKSSKAVAAAPAPEPVSEDAVRAKIADARTRLMFRYPFLGYLVSNLDDRLGAEFLRTAGTDGRSVFWSNAFVAGLSNDDAMFVLAHEAMHCALQHPFRRGGRDHRRFNIATDAVTNDMLFESGLTSTLPLIRGAKGRSAEEVYEDIDELVDANGGKDNLVDDHGPWLDAKDADANQLADAWRAALGNARQFGKMPAGVARMVDGILNPKRDWRALLREGIFFPEDYSWSPTDRRFAGIMLPTLRGEVHRVVVAIDTSGSIDGDKLAAFWAEISAIMRDNRCEARVLTCDAAVQDEWGEHEFDPRVVRPVRGGGGTSFAPVFAKVAEYAAGGWTPEAVVYLTDLDGEFPKHAPDLRTIWIVRKEDGGKKVPFGEVIEVE